MIKVLKKASVFALIATMLVSTVACNKKTDEGLSIGKQDNVVENADKNSDATPTPTPTPTPLTPREKLEKAVKTTMETGDSIKKIIGDINWFKNYGLAENATLKFGTILDAEGEEIGIDATFVKDKSNNGTAFELNGSLNSEKFATLRMSTSDEFVKLAIPQLFNGYLSVNNYTLEEDLKGDTNIALAIQELLASTEETGDVDVNSFDIDSIKAAIKDVKNLKSVLAFKEAYKNLMDTAEYTESKEHGLTKISVVVTDDAFVDFGVSGMAMIKEAAFSIIESVTTVDNDEFNLEEIESDLIEMTQNIESYKLDFYIREDGLLAVLYFELNVAEPANQITYEMTFDEGAMPLNEIYVKAYKKQLYGVMTEDAQYDIEAGDYFILPEYEVSYTVEDTYVGTYSVTESSENSLHLSLNGSSTVKRTYADGEVDEEESSSIALSGTVEKVGDGFELTYIFEENEDADISPARVTIAFDPSKAEDIPFFGTEYELLKMTDGQILDLVTEIEEAMSKDMFLSMLIGSNSYDDTYEEDMYYDEMNGYWE